MIWCLRKVLPCALVLLGISCVPTEQNPQFTLLLTVDAAPELAAASIMLTPGNVRLHVSGTPRAAGWTPEDLDDAHWAPLPSKAQSIDLLSLTGESSRTLAQAAIQRTLYDHLYVEVAALEAMDAAGNLVPCKNVIEPIALELNLLESEDTRVLLELYIAANWPEEGHCSVMAKEATLLQPTR